MVAVVHIQFPTHSVLQLQLIDADAQIMILFSGMLVRQVETNTQVIIWDLLVWCQKAKSSVFFRDLSHFHQIQGFVRIQFLIK